MLIFSLHRLSTRELLIFHTLIRIYFPIGSFSLQFNRFLTSFQITIFSLLFFPTLAFFSSFFDGKTTSGSFDSYLIEDQVKGPSSCEGYERALLSGCRLVKIDTHDGPDGRPLVYHGNTLTSKICAESVLETIEQNAFLASP